MNLQQEIEEIQSQIKAGKFVNEASVFQGIVWRLLSALGWDIFDPSCVSFQYSKDSRQVDCTLCHPPNAPIVAIAVKGTGEVSEGEKRLFEYATYRDVPMAVLTDGQEWYFFLPGEQECIYKLDILAHPISESIDILHKYLAYDNVVSGDAIEAARNDYHKAIEERQVRDALSTAWYQLLNEPDELLIELVAERVEALYGFKPEPETVARFIGTRVPFSPPEPLENFAPQKDLGNNSPQSLDDFVPLKDLGYLAWTKPSRFRLPNGEIKEIKTWKEVLVESCKFALEHNPRIPIPLPDKAGKKRTLLSYEIPTSPGRIEQMPHPHNETMVYIYVQYSANDCVENALLVLEHVPEELMKETPAIILRE